MQMRYEIGSPTDDEEQGREGSGSRATRQPKSGLLAGRLAVGDDINEAELTLAAHHNHLENEAISLFLSH